MKVLLSHLGPIHVLHPSFETYRLRDGDESRQVEQIKKITASKPCTLAAATLRCADVAASKCL